MVQLLAKKRLDRNSLKIDRQKYSKQKENGILSHKQFDNQIEST